MKQTPVSTRPVRGTKPVTHDRRRHWHKLTPDRRSTVCDLAGYDPGLERGPLLSPPVTPLCPVCHPQESS